MQAFNNVLAAKSFVAKKNQASQPSYEKIEVYNAETDSKQLAFVDPKSGHMIGIGDPEPEKRAKSLVWEFLEKDGKFFKRQATYDPQTKELLPLKGADLIPLTETLTGSSAEIRGNMKQLRDEVNQKVGTVEGSGAKLITRNGVAELNITDPELFDKTFRKVYNAEFKNYVDAGLLPPSIPNILGQEVNTEEDRVVQQAFTFPEKVRKFTRGKGRGAKEYLIVKDQNELLRVKSDPKNKGKFIVLLDKRNQEGIIQEIE